jgi:hypothetical protein
MRFPEKTAVFWWGGKKRHDLRPLNSLVLIIPTSCNGGIFLRELVGLIMSIPPTAFFSKIASRDILSVGSHG